MVQIEAVRAFCTIAPLAASNLPPITIEQKLMKRIRALSVVFNNIIQPYEVEAFRGAVILKAGIKNYLYHNHLPNGKFLYRYPLIQYKSLQGKPMLFCIDEGVNEAHHFFSQMDRKIFISGKELDLKIENLILRYYTMQVWDKNFKYSIRNWIALNSKNYSIYQQLTTETQQKEMLEKILIGNIISFAKGINWTIDKVISLTIEKIEQIKPIQYKGQKLMAFKAIFQTNVFLPDYIGLGKGVSHGMGIVKHLKNEG